MYENKMYGELVWYMEACESGSMFPDLQSDRNVYAITATDAEQSSWGTYCGDSAVVDGVNLNTCLGDLFSVNWMQDTESADISSETLAVQFENVKEATYKSPVQKFGDFSFTNEVIGEFEGNLDAELEEEHSKKTWGEKMLHKMQKFGD